MTTSVRHNVILDEQFPVRTISGARRWVAFAGLAETTGDHPVEFMWPRADLNTAAYELAVGLATLALQPITAPDWERYWESPPSPADLADAITPYSHAFNLLGDGPQFMQVPLARADALPINSLFIGSRSERASSNNTILSGPSYGQLGPAAAAMALYALQQFALSGGRGYRTSIRGGGPLTTLVMPGDLNAPLWRRIWANVLDRPENRVTAADLPRALPWLAPPILDRQVHEADRDAHPLQAHFGMPRRIRLDTFNAEGICDLSRTAGPVVRNLRHAVNGVDYGPWRHPLTPYVRATGLSLKPSPIPSLGDRVVIYGSDDIDPALIVHRARNARAAQLGRDADVLAMGWATDNAIAECYRCDAMPLHCDRVERDDKARRMLAGARFAAIAVRSAVRQALMPHHSRTALMGGVLDQAARLFDEHLNDVFDRAIETAAPIEHWRDELIARASRAFTTVAPMPLISAERGRLIAEAHGRMVSTLNGSGAAGRTFLLSLGMTPTSGRWRAIR